jgi:hypothetical protein
MQRPKGCGFTIDASGMAHYAADCGIIILFQHSMYIFRQAKSQYALYIKTAVFLCIESQWIDIPKEIF